MYDIAVTKGHTSVDDVKATFKKYVENKFLPLCIQSCAEADFSKMSRNPHDKGLVVTQDVFKDLTLRHAGCFERHTSPDLIWFSFIPTSQPVKIVQCSKCDTLVTIPTRLKWAKFTKKKKKEFKKIHKCDDMSSESSMSISSRDDISISSRDGNSTSFDSCSTPPRSSFARNDNFGSPFQRPTFLSPLTPRVQATGIYRCDFVYTLDMEDFDLSIRCKKKFLTFEELTKHRQGCKFRHQNMEITQPKSLGHVLFNVARQAQVDNHLVNSAHISILKGDHSPKIKFVEAEATHNNVSKFSLEDCKNPLLIFNEQKNVSRRKDQIVNVVPSVLLQVLKGQFGMRKLYKLTKCLRSANVKVDRSAVLNIKDLRAWTRDQTTFSLIDNMKRNNNSEPTNALILSFTESGVLDFVSCFVMKNSQLIQSSDHFVVTIDSDSKSNKLVGSFASRDYTMTTDKAILLCYGRFSESVENNRLLLERAQIDAIGVLLAQYNIKIKLVMDQKSLSYVLNIAGPQGNNPCGFCHILRNRKQCPERKKFGIRRYGLSYASNSQHGLASPEWHDAHYGERLLSDWNNPEMMQRPLPDIVRSLFEVTNTSRIMDVVSIGPLHLTLAVNALTDHLLDYK